MLGSLESKVATSKSVISFILFAIVFALHLSIAGLKSQVTLNSLSNVRVQLQSSIVEDSHSSQLTPVTHNLTGIKAKICIPARFHERSFH